MWHAVVDEAFVDKHTTAAQRQRLLAVELGRNGKWVMQHELRRLTPSLLEAYLGKTSKTLSRDINRLVEMRFIEVDPSTRVVRARLELVQGMRPFVITE